MLDIMYRFGLEGGLGVSLAWDCTSIIFCGVGIHISILVHKLMPFDIYIYMMYFSYLHSLSKFNVNY